MGIGELPGVSAIEPHLYELEQQFFNSFGSNFLLQMWKSSLGNIIKFVKILTKHKNRNF